MNDEAFANKVFNIGNDTIITIKELAETIIRLTNSASQIVYLPPLEDGDMTRRQPDITKMKSLLNRDLKPLEEGIKEVLKAIEFGVVEA
jgi:UDP-glucose 4-epimerase